MSDGVNSDVRLLMQCKPMEVHRCAPDPADIHRNPVSTRPALILVSTLRSYRSLAQSRGIAEAASSTGFSRSLVLAKRKGHPHAGWPSLPHPHKGATTYVATALPFPTRATSPPAFFWPSAVALPVPILPADLDAESVREASAEQARGETESQSTSLSPFDEQRRGYA
jgi:hypothetical protein